MAEAIFFQIRFDLNFFCVVNIGKFPARYVVVEFYT